MNSQNAPYRRFSRLAALGGLVASCWLIPASATAVPSLCSPMPHPGDADIDQANDYDAFTFVVETLPGGVDVFVDGTAVYPGRYVGTTDAGGFLNVMLPNLRHGPHQLLFRKPGYADLPYYFVSSDIFTGINLTGGSAITMYYHVLEAFTTMTILTEDKTDPAFGGELDVGAHAAPTVVDVDFNSTRDLIVGNQAGALRLFRNFKDFDSGTDFGHPEQLGTFACKDGTKDGVPTPPAPSEPNECVRLTSGTYAKPHVVDWNNDGLFDLLVGSSDGRVYLYRGIHDKIVPFDRPREIQSFCYLAETVVDLNVDFPFPPSGGYASPWVVDWNGDRVKDLLVGSANNHLYLYLGQGPETDFADPVLLPGVEILDRNGGALALEARPNPTAMDINHDGTTDLLLAGQNQIRGHFAFSPGTPNYDAGASVLMSINPDSQSTPITSFMLGSNYLTALLVDMSPNLANDLTSNYFMRDLLVGAADGKIRAYSSRHIDGDVATGSGDVLVNGLDLIKINQCLGASEGQPGYHPHCDVGQRDGVVDLADRDLAVANFAVHLDTCGNGVREGRCPTGTGAGQVCSASNPCPDLTPCDYTLGHCITGTGIGELCSATLTCPGAGTCDNSISEQCDDGNQENLDGCTQDCLAENCVPTFVENFANDAAWSVSDPVINPWVYQGAGLGFNIFWDGAVDTADSFLSSANTVDVFDNSYMIVREEYSGTKLAGCSVSGLRDRSCANSLPAGIIEKRYDVSKFGSPGGTPITLQFNVGGLFGASFANETADWTVQYVELGRCDRPF